MALLSDATIQETVALARPPQPLCEVSFLLSRAAAERKRRHRQCCWVYTQGFFLVPRLHTQNARAAFYLSCESHVWLDVNWLQSPRPLQGFSLQNCSFPRVCPGTLNHWIARLHTVPWDGPRGRGPSTRPESHTLSGCPARDRGNNEHPTQKLPSRITMSLLELGAKWRRVTLKEAKVQ